MPKQIDQPVTKKSVLSPVKKVVQPTNLGVRKPTSQDLKPTKEEIQKSGDVQIEIGQQVVVTTLYKVKRVIEQGNTTLIACEDEFGDRVLVFRKQELELR